MQQSLGPTWQLPRSSLALLGAPGLGQLEFSSRRQLKHFQQTLTFGSGGQLGISMTIQSKPGWALE
jgi:hypothetical protein